MLLLLLLLYDIILTIYAPFSPDAGILSWHLWHSINYHAVQASLRVFLFRSVQQSLNRYLKTTDNIVVNFNINKSVNSTGEYNKGRSCNNSKIDTLISKRSSVENKAKLSQLETQNTFSAVLFYLQFPVERASLCSLHKFKENQFLLIEVLKLS